MIAITDKTAGPNWLNFFSMEPLSTTQKNQFIFTKLKKKFHGHCPAPQVRF